MKIKLICAASLIALASMANAETIATVNGQPIDKQLQDLWMSEVTKNGGQDTPEARKQILDNLIAGTVVEQEAQKLGLDKSPEVEFGVKYAKFRLMQEALVRDYLKKHPITEEQLKKYYDEQVQKMGKEQFEVRHILVKDKKLADELEGRIKKGESFEMLAKQYSIDPGAKDTAGYLGWASPSSFVKPFGDAVSKMKKGDISKAPVQTEFGWHIIKVEDTRPQQVPAFDEVKDQIAHGLEQQTRADFVQKLLKDAKITYPTAPAKN